MNKKTYYIFTLGCQMNESDSERLESMLLKAGYQPARELEADLIVVNACSVRQKPIDRIWGKIRLWQKSNPQARIVLTGCLTKQDKEKFKEELDLVFSIEETDQLVDLLSLESDYQDYFKIKPNYSYQDKAFVPIMTGCNNFCSYCVVPYTRGRERSRTQKEIIDEVNYLIGKGVEKIVLLGQNVNSYAGQRDTKGKKKANFVELLRDINNLPGNFEIEFMTSHPKDMSQELILAIGDLDKVSSWVHLPVQSGDNQILKSMNRGYTREKYLDLVDSLRKYVENLKLTTDIIVGFPGEDKNNFENTVSLAKEVEFDGGYVSRYSPRPGTKAWKLDDNVSREEKKRRWKVLDSLINKKKSNSN